MVVRIYDSGYRGPCKSERCEQIDAMSWQEFNYPDRAILCFHPANESMGTAKHHELRRKEGVKPGVSDIIDLSGCVVGIFEMKRLDRTKSKTSKAQKDFLAAGDAAGHFVAICYGASQFMLAYSQFAEYCSSQGAR